MNYKKLLYLILLINLFPADVYSNIILKLNENNPRTAALGATASLSGVLSENPASFVAVENNFVSAANNNYLSDISVMTFKYAVKIKKIKGTINAGYSAFDSGKIRKTLITGSISFADAGSFDLTEKMFNLGYSVKIDKLSLGINSKYITADYAGIKENSNAFDAGFFYDFEFMGDALSVSGMIKNIGNSFSFDREKYKVPLTYRMGLSSESDFLAEDCYIKFCAEAVYDKENDFDGAAGCEINYNRTIFLRAGYNSVQDAGTGFSTGVGLRYKGFDFDYAWVPYSNLGDAHYIGLSYNF
ncbi:MAG TPA: PorV/PorQ family protein [bacterium]|nr:PorV/PorQ family protein [bacterium]HPN30894.1 PorV/PorQ family protein [bacterium]